MLGMALRNAAILRYLRREPEATRELARATIALAEQYNFREHVRTARSLSAWAMTELGQVESGTL
jgi:hypothetical protein